MASGLETKLMMAVYNEALILSPSMFLSSFFGKNSSELYFTLNETVEVDIRPASKPGCGAPGRSVGIVVGHPREP